MKLITTYESDVDFEQWNKELIKSNYALASQTANWQYAFKEIYNSEPFFIYVYDEQKTLLGQLAGVIHDKFFWEGVNSITKQIGKNLNLGKTLYWLYGPLIYEHAIKDEILNEILIKINDLAIQNNISIITGFTSPMSNIDSVKWNEFGYDLQEWKTYVVDLTKPIEEIYDSLPKKVRYDIRKSEKENFQLEIVTEKKSLMEYHELKIKLKKMQGGKISNETFFDSRWRLLHEQGYAQLIAARLDNKMIGGTQILTMNGNTIQHVVGTLPGYSSVGTFLTWNAIKWAKENNFNTFDFGGANPSPNSEKEKRIDFYKSKWTGKEFRYYICTKKVNPIKFNISTILKNPSKITQVITKRIRKN